MLEIVKYEVEKGILTVGFKDVEKGFVVYASVPYDENKSKDQLIQEAYIQAYPSIKYERSLDTHSITTNETGLPFTPEPSHPARIEIQAPDKIEFTSEEMEETSAPVNVLVYDQYGELYDTEVSLFTDLGTIEEGILKIPKVDSYREATITATVGNLTESKIIQVFPYYLPVNDNPSGISNEMIFMAEAIVDLESRLTALEQRLSKLGDGD